jgi:hypothetical protein
MTRAAVNYDTVYHNEGTHAGSDIGYLVDDRFVDEGVTDVSYFRIVSTNPSFTAYARVVYEVTANDDFTLFVSAEVENHPQGATRCHTGRGENNSLGTDCGVVQNASYRAEDIEGTIDVNDLVKISATGGLGDSGGPVFWHNPDNNLVKGAGIYSGQECYDDSEHHSCPNNADADYSFYTPIYHARTADNPPNGNWNLTLDTSTHDGCNLPGQHLGSPDYPACLDDVGGDY